MKVYLGKKTAIALLAICLPFMGNAQNKEALQTIELTLDKAIEIALSENPSVQIADLEIEKKKYAKQGTQSSLYPQIDAVGQYSRAIKKQVTYSGSDKKGADSGGGMASMFEPLFMGMEETFKQTNPNYVEGTLMQNIAANQVESQDGFSFGRDNTWSGGFQVNWPLVVPTLWKSIEISSLDIELAVEAARASKIDMINSVRKSYYQVLLAQDSRDVLQESYNNAVLNYENIREKFNQGIVSEFDMIRADVNAKNIKPNLVQAQNALDLASLSLKAFMGIDMEQPILIKGNLKDYEDGLYEELLSINPSLDNNSDLKQFDVQADMLSKTLQLYKAQYLPTLAVSGNYMWMASSDHFKFGDYKWDPFSTVSVSISIPIFDGFKKRSDVRQTKVNLEQMKWQREDIVRNLNLAINNGVNNMTNYIEQIYSTKDVVVQAQKGYEISQKLYDTGMGTLIELNDAQLGLTQASLAYNQAIYNFLSSKADLDKTLGLDPSTIISNNK